MPTIKFTKKNKYIVLRRTRTYSSAQINRTGFSTTVLQCHEKNMQFFFQAMLNATRAKVNSLIVTIYQAKKNTTKSSVIKSSPDFFVESHS